MRIQATPFSSLFCAVSPAFFCNTVKIMAISKLLVASIAIALVIFGVRSDTSLDGDADVHVASESTPSFELDRLRSKISTLESSIEDRLNEIKINEESIMRLNAIIQEKLSSIKSLESEIESLQKKGAADAKRVSGMVDARVGELEKQILKLRNEIEAQSKKKTALDARSNGSEKKVQELKLRLENLHKTKEEQKQRIRKTQHALELAEEQLMKAQLEATSKLKELTEVDGAWLPPWLATHINNIQDLAATHWREHVKRMLVLILHKASAKMAQVQKWAEPHWDSARTKWVPAAVEQLVTFKSNAESYLRKMSVKTFEVYEASKRTIAPHIVKIQDVAYPYYQEARKFSKLYTDQVVIVTKPHLEKLFLALKPYTKHVAQAYRKFLKRVRTYHRQVQDIIHEKLKKHELTKPHATKELAWFMASALLGFPMFFMYRILGAVFSTIYCSKKINKRPKQNIHASKPHRRPKRRHADK